jgi:branched-chain amino acid transport system permease protein
VIWVNDIIQGILLGGLYALFACGLSLMFGVMKVINLAHGDLAVVAAYVALGVIALTHIPGVWSFVLVVPIMAVGGYFLQRTLIQASLERGTITTLLVTFGLSIVIENVLLQFLSANSHSIPAGSFATSSFSIGSQISIAWLDLIILAVAVAVLLVLQIYLARSRNGRLIRAVADDREAAQLAGADYRHIFGIAAAIALGTVALAGVAYFGMYSQFDPTIGTGQLLLYAFEVVVIGGLGSLWGTLAGGIVLGVVQQIGAQIGGSAHPDYQFLAGQLVFLAVLVVLPEGLTGLGRRTA